MNTQPVSTEQEAVESRFAKVVFDLNQKPTDDTKAADGWISIDAEKSMLDFILSERKQAKAELLGEILKNLAERGRLKIAVKHLTLNSREVTELEGQERDLMFGLLGNLDANTSIIQDIKSLAEKEGITLC